MLRLVSQYVVTAQYLDEANYIVDVFDLYTSSMVMVY